MTDDPVARLKAGLDKDEGRARLRLAAEADRMSIAPAFALRIAAAHREVISLHVPLEDCQPAQCVVCLEYVPCRTLRALAAIYSDDAT